MKIAVILLKYLATTGKKRPAKRVQQGVTKTSKFLKRTMKEFRDMSFGEICACIEGEPECGTVQKQHVEEFMRKLSSMMP